jgi:hypothetical protein
MTYADRPLRFRSNADARTGGGPMSNIRLVRQPSGELLIVDEASQAARRLEASRAAVAAGSAGKRRSPVQRFSRSRDRHTSHRCGAGVMASSDPRALRRLIDTARN